MRASKHRWISVFEGGNPFLNCGNFAGGEVYTELNKKSEI